MSSIVSLIAGAASAVPRGVLYAVIGALVAAAVGAGWKSYATGQRLAEARDAAATLRAELGACQARAADLSASVSNLRAGIADQNAAIQGLRADGAQAEQSARDAAEPYRTAPARGIADDITPDDVNETVRDRIEDLTR